MRRKLLGFGVSVVLGVCQAFGQSTSTATAFYGSGQYLQSLNASNLSSGTVPVARLGMGTENRSTFLRG